MSKELSERQRAFVQKYVKERKPKSVAYAEAYNRDASHIHTQSAASHLARTRKVADAITDLRAQFEADAEKAYLLSWKETEKETTPAVERLKWYKHVLALAGHSGAPTHLQQNNTQVIVGLNDEESVRAIVRSYLSSSPPIPSSPPHNAP